MFKEIIKRLFPEPITLEEFINVARPQTLQEVYFLETQYWELQEQWRFFTKD